MPEGHPRKLRRALTLTLQHPGSSSSTSDTSPASAAAAAVGSLHIAMRPTPRPVRPPLVPSATLQYPALVSCLPLATATAVQVAPTAMKVRAPRPAPPVPVATPPETPTPETSSSSSSVSTTASWSTAPLSPFVLPLPNRRFHEDLESSPLTIVQEDLLPADVWVRVRLGLGLGLG